MTQRQLKHPLPLHLHRTLVLSWKNPIKSVNRSKKHATRIPPNQRSPALLHLLLYPAQTHSRPLPKPTLCKVHHLNRTGGNIANALNRNSNTIGKNGTGQTTLNNKGQQWLTDMVDVSPATNQSPHPTSTPHTLFFV
jgi:hypothetical protein